MSDATREQARALAWLTLAGAMVGALVAWVRA